jgi:hypothetical protein
VEADPLIAVATSSGSVLLMEQRNGSACCPAAFAVHVRKRQRNGRYAEWAVLAAPLLGRRLPLDVMVTCEHSCAFKLKALGESTVAALPPALQIEQELVVIPDAESAVSQDVSTPRVGTELPYPPAIRLHYFVNPPLSGADAALQLGDTPTALQRASSTTTAAARAFLAALASTMSSEHNPVRADRLSLVDVSSTGAFVSCDVLPEDIFVHGSGPEGAATAESSSHLPLREPSTWAGRGCAVAGCC